MKKKMILFDLDGTLLPMDEDLFVKYYFKMLAEKLIPYGYEPEKLFSAIWAGVGSMVKNDGSITNEEAFWDCFTKIFGEKSLDDKPVFEEFYGNEFQKAQAVCGFQEKASSLIHTLSENGYRVALATNPIFPEIATRSRIRWAGLEYSDFELVTTYENSHHSKPNPAYYLDITGQLGIAPSECVMIGNNVEEDMIAETLGMKVFLLTDCLINKKEADISVYPHGNFDDLCKFLEELS